MPLTEPGIRYRFLRPDEISEVEAIFKEFGCEVPQTARIWAGEEDGELVSLQCMHQVWHLGPVWVRPDRRGRGIWAEMQTQLEKQLGAEFGFYQFGTEKNETQLKRLGLEPTKWTVWFKKLGTDG